MSQKFYLARFAPYVFFVPFVVNFLEFVLRVLIAFVVKPYFVVYSPGSCESSQDTPQFNQHFLDVIE